MPKVKELAKWTLGRAHRAEGTARTEALGRGRPGWLGREQWGGVQRDEGVGRPRRASQTTGRPLLCVECEAPARF